MIVEILSIRIVRPSAKRLTRTKGEGYTYVCDIYIFVLHRYTEAVCVERYLWESLG